MAKESSKKPNFGSPVLDALQELAKEKYPKNCKAGTNQLSCPHCRCSAFYLFDGCRLFCTGCGKELRINTNFLGGKIIT